MIDNVRLAVIRAKLKDVAVPTVVSLLYRKGLRGMMMQGPRPLNLKATRMIGRAFTVRTIPVREDLADAMQRGEMPNLQGQATEQLERDDVLVVAMDGESRTAYMGDIMATMMMLKGVAGCVLDGGVSDAAAIADMPFPLFCSGTAGTPVTSHRMVVELQAPVGCGGAPVFPGDIIFADTNGVAVIPAYLADEIATAAMDREAFESWVIAEALTGRSLKGLYPITAETRATYDATRKER